MAPIKPKFGRPLLIKCKIYLGKHPQIKINGTLRNVRQLKVTSSPHIIRPLKLSTRHDHKKRLRGGEIDNKKIIFTEP